MTCVYQKVRPQWLAVCEPGPQAQPRRRSVYGRPRALSSQQVATILSWADSRVTLKALAKSLGVSPETVKRIIRSRGTHFKSPPPEERAETLTAHRARRRALKEANLL
jgi:hypothetical protein